MNFFNNLINHMHSKDKINKKCHCLRFHFIGGKSIIITFLFIITMMATILPVSLIMYHIPLGHNEGWNAYNIEQAMHPELGSLYPDKNNGLIFNNYPPLSYYIVGLFDKITMHDYIISGRIVNLFFILISVFCLSSVVVMMGGGAFGAIFSAFMLIIYAGHYFQGWFAENDPQWIGIGLQLLGVIFAIRSVQDNSNAYNLFISSLFCVLGFYTKHNEVSLILFIMLYLFFSDRKKTLLFSVYFFSMIFAFLFIFYIIYGYNFLYDVFLHPRIQVLHQITKASPKVKMFAPLICVSFYYFKINGLNKKNLHY